jgi:hypothetical protein
LSSNVYLIEIFQTFKQQTAGIQEPMIKFKKKKFKKKKKNSQPDFASWPLRRRTDEEIIRL